MPIGECPTPLPLCSELLACEYWVLYLPRFNIPLANLSSNMSIADGSCTRLLKAFVSASSHLLRSLPPISELRSLKNADADADDSLAVLSFLPSVRAADKSISLIDNQEMGYHTHSDHFHKVRVIHLKVQQLLPMWSRHPTRRCGNNIQCGPKGFDYFPIYPTRSRNEQGGIPRVAFGTMSVYMPDTDSGDDFQVVRKGDMGTTADPRSELLHVCTVNVIKAYDPVDLPHIKAKGIGDRIVHIHLSEGYLATRDQS